MVRNVQNVISFAKGRKQRAGLKAGTWLLQKVGVVVRKTVSGCQHLVYHSSPRHARLEHAQSLCACSWMESGSLKSSCAVSHASYLSLQGGGFYLHLDSAALSSC